MVGSRRVKAQSKMGTGEVGSAVLGRLGLCGKLGLCMLAVHLPRSVLAPHTYWHHLFAVFCLPFRLPVFLVFCSCPAVSAFCLASPTVFCLTQALLDQYPNPVLCLA